ncbi:SirB2 family protein [Psychromonas aquimarina]|uniref:SirB2 family protein n=1 Tax=Psychromonas aquimarina TaxID=444919 RepID=UPI00040B5F73|nr:SirB2 family protein [Psychromonas aquimarina]
MDYLLVKNIHMGAAYLSISLFIFRSVLSVAGSALLQHKLLKTVPHVIDTVLLLCAIYLMFTIEQYPFINSWLTAKFIALTAYIAAGTIALKRGKSAVIRFWAALTAVIIFIYIIGAAKNHHALSWLTIL